MSHTPVDSHFIGDPKIELLGHRPHKTAKMVFQAITATAIFRIWPTLLFFGGWSTAIVLINKKTSAELTVPSTMLTVLGVLLGLTLSYRTSSAYDRYWEGRRMWSQIILGARTWSRMVWIHCPDSLVVAVPEGTEPNPHDESQAILEKYTMVQMSLAFAVAVKHYLRGEEGILYDDLYHLVRFIPSLNLPSGIPSSSDANNAIGPAYSRHVLRQSSVETDIEGGTTSSTSNDEKLSSHQDPHLHPARQPPVFRWSETFPFSLFLSSHQKAKVAQRKMYRRKMKEVRQGGGVGHNVPLEVTLFMSCWIAQMQKRKTIDVPTINALLAAVQSMSDALISLERILTTPIPWSYNAHIWEVTWVYCLLLPFQLYGAGFNWVTVPAVVITTYIVVGFAEIGSEIENPFGYDANDLNLDFFVNDIIKKELDAITARPFAPPEDWVFSATNVVGKAGEGKHAAQMQYLAADRVSDILQNRSRSTGDDGMRHRARSPV